MSRTTACLVLIGLAIACVVPAVVMLATGYVALDHFPRAEALHGQRFGTLAGAGFAFACAASIVSQIGGRR